MGSTTLERTRTLIAEALHEVYDPELGVNVVDLGLVYDIDVTEEGFVTITMTLTTPGCPMHESLDIPGLTGGEIRLVWEPAWTPERMTEEGKRLLGFC